MAQLVRDVMTPGAATVRPEASLVEAARLMRAQDIGEVLVADSDRLIGVITDRDITVRAVADGSDPMSVTAGSVCTPDPLYVGPDEEVEAAVDLMRRRSVRRLPVVADGRPLGVLSLGDLALARDDGSPV